MARLLALLLLCISFTLQGNELSKAPSHCNKRTAKQSCPLDPNKGVLDGKRKYPERVTFTDAQKEKAKKIQHVIVIFQENWSFDSLYGKFPGANGLGRASSERMQQIDLMGNPYPQLPACINTNTGETYETIPTKLPNGPFDLSSYIPIDSVTGDLVHQFYQEQYQINGGQMNRFSTWSDAGGFVMSYYDASNTEMGQIAKEFVLCDNWFHSCYGGSTLGVLWLFTAQMPRWPKAPKDLIATIYPSGIMIDDGLVSTDGYLINDAQPAYPPHSLSKPASKRAPPQNYPTIGDRLSEKGVSWKWYAQGWNNAVAGKPDHSFAFHHQAPVYFSQFAPATVGRKEHLFDLDDFMNDLENGNVPAVSFIRSIDRFSEHPGDGALLSGLNWCASLIRKIQKSSMWEDCLIIVTYDENGGRWDHVPPPVVDRFGPGTRVPAIIISPFAKKGYIDSTSYETVSILKFIEERWELAPLSKRDAAANNILNALDL